MATSLTFFGAQCLAGGAGAAAAAADEGDFDRVVAGDGVSLAGIAERGGQCATDDGGATGFEELAAVGEIGRSVVRRGGHDSDPPEAVRFGSSPDGAVRY